MTSQPLPPIFIQAATEAQLDRFIRKLGFQKKQVRRIWDIEDIMGLHPGENPLLILPGCRTKQHEEVRYWWAMRGGQEIRLNRDQEDGEEPILFGRKSR